MTILQRTTLGLFAALLTTSLGTAAAAEPATSPALAADLAYATAWHSNDPERVMATVTDDVVLQPSGLPTLRGAEAARAFWFPEDGAATTVRVFELDQEAIEVSGDLAWVSGSFRLEFDYGGTAYASRGVYLSVLRRGDDGVWRIAARMWNDHARE